MFSNKTKETAPAPQPAATQPAAKRGPRGSAAPSIISADLVVSGTLSSAGDIQVDGRVEGDVRSAGLVIGDKAEVHGEIYAEEVTVRGKVVGRINARKILLASTSHVEGDILHEAFAVESGAFFEGNCRHSDDPLANNPLDKPSRQLSAPASAQPAPALPPVNTLTPGATLSPLGVG
jgi:cytoskeletal protein CcmA (bactofilin family)